VTKRFFVGVLILSAATSMLAAQSKPSIRGVWRVIETTGGLGAGSPTATNAKPQPGFYIFTENHYSITRVLGDKPRMIPKDENNPTLSELQDANRLQAQFGTYETKGDTITFRLSVARNPPIMNTAAPLTGTFKLDGNTLTLTTKNATTGQVSVVRLTRVE
jgi:hypothetical protein